MLKELYASSLVLPAVLLLSASVQAQPGLANGDFDSNLASWNLIESAPGVSAVWSNDDVDGAPDSGSAELIDANPGNNGTQIVLTQCVPLAGATFPIPYSAKARVFKDGETESIGGQILVAEYLDAACTQFSGAQFVDAVNFDSDQWQSFSDSYERFVAEAQAVRIELAIFKASGTQSGGRVRFDDVRFGQVLLDQIFADDFSDSSP